VIADYLQVHHAFVIDKTFSPRGLLLEIRKPFSDDILRFSDQPSDNFAGWYDLRDSPNTLTCVHDQAPDSTWRGGVWSNTSKSMNILVLETDISA